MSDGPLLSSWSAESDRHAFVVEEEQSVWLLLSEPGDPQPVLACWLFNTPAAPAEPDMAHYEAQGLPPPVPAALVVEGGVMPVAADAEWTLSWGPGGHSVALVLGEEAVGLVAADPPRSLCRFLAQAGPWGEPWDDAAAAEIFGIELDL